MRPSSAVQLAFLAAICVAAPGCEDDDASPTGPTPVTGGNPPAASGATQVRGTERIAWNQAGDTSRLRFRAYVDNRPVELSAAKCNSARPEAECSSPLPALTDGVHTIQLANVSASGVESERSAPITLQKVSARATASSLPLASSRGPARPESLIRIADGLEFAADIVATGVRAPAQLAALPDGRLLVSEAGGQVRIVHPGEPESRHPALDASLLSPASIGPLGVAAHPDFARNRLVYVSLLEEDGRSGRIRLRVLRLREVGGALGEPATLFEAPVCTAADDAGDRLEPGTEAAAGPRMAFGPDRLLYLMLPPGLEFVNEPAASTPLASMLRLSDDGRASSEPLSGISATPLAFTWSPTGALWVMFRGADGVAALRSLDARARVQTASSEPARLRVREGTGAAGRTLYLRSGPDNLLVAQALVAARADGSKGMARVALPVQADGRASDRIGDVVAGEGGTLFVTTSNLPPGTLVADRDVVVRLTPVAPAAAR